MFQMYGLSSNLIFYNFKKIGIKHKDSLQSDKNNTKFNLYPTNVENWASS
jgi:hypothetical protein